MTQQTARILINAQALVGALIQLTGAKGEPVPLQAGHDAIHNLKPGDKVTIEILSDERWIEAQAAERKRLEDLDKAAADNIDANPQAGPNLTGKPGMTLAEGLQQADRAQPDVDASAGTVATDDGAQVTRSTEAAAPASTGTTRATRATRSTQG